MNLTLLVSGSARSLTDVMGELPHHVLYESLRGEDYNVLAGNVGILS